MIEVLKKKGLVLLLLLIQLNVTEVFSQGTDTALYRTLRVSKMSSWVKFPMMVRQRDSCLSEERLFDNDGKVTYIKSNYGCMGWSRVDETFFTYNDKQHITEIILKSNDEVVSIARYKYSPKGNISEEMRISIEPMDTMILKYEQTFDRKDRMTVERVSSNQPELQPAYIRNLTYKNDLLTQVEVVNDTGEILAKYTYVYNDKDQLTDETSEVFKPTYSYTKELYDYNDGVLIRHTSTADNTATEFIYQGNGLVNQTLWYNRFGQMDRVYFNHYLYREDVK